MFGTMCFFSAKQLKDNYKQNEALNLLSLGVSIIAEIILSMVSYLGV